MPTIDYELSGSSSIFVSWVRNTDDAEPGGLITGYSLYMDDGYGGAFTEILNTVGTSPLISEYLTTGLTLSLTYRFKVVAYNYNPEPGAASDFASLQVCQKPSDWAAPTKLTTSQTSIAINWNEPLSNGGCTILGYAVFVDDGSTGSFIEANVENDATVRLKPSLSYLQITRLALANLGQTFRIKVRAYNTAGEIESPILGVVLASLPLEPPAPSKVLAYSSHL